MVSGVPVAQQAMMIMMMSDSSQEALHAFLHTSEYTRMYLRTPKFPGGACPQTLLEWTACRAAMFSASANDIAPPRCKKLCTALLDIHSGTSSTWSSGIHNYIYLKGTHAGTAPSGMGGAARGIIDTAVLLALEMIHNEVSLSKQQTANLSWTHYYFFYCPILFCRNLIFFL